MKKSIFLFFIGVTLLSFNAFGVEFLYKHDDGTHYFRCNHCCEKVKVYTQRGGYYRVYTTYFGKVLKAGSPYEAAKAVCKAYQKRKQNRMEKPEAKD